MWQERQAELLQEEIQAVLSALSEAGDLYALVKEPLTKGRRALAAESAQEQPWPLLPLIVCEAICEHYEQALPAAVAIQFFIAAGDVFDDIEDADSSESLAARHGAAVATNVATTLLILAETAIARLKRKGVEDYVIIRVMDAVNSFYTTACTGQHLDLSLTPDIAISEDRYLKVICMKSASQIECACHIGALLATENERLIDTFGIFGHNLGMAAQITNDIQGIIRGSDILNHKITLPVVYALAQSDGKARHQLEITFSRQTELTPDPIRIRDLLFHLGAVHYATLKMEYYKQRALDILSKAVRAGADVERLKLFLG